MSEVERLLFEEDGEIYTIFVESKATPEIPEPEVPEDDRESYGFREDAIVKLQEVHGTIRAYTKYALGAFKNFSEAQVEEITLKFGLKISGKAGIPILTEGSAESNFEIQVKCKFPDTQTTKAGDETGKGT